MLRHLDDLHIMAGMEKAMKAAKKATRKECLTVSTGSSGIVLGPLLDCFIDSVWLIFLLVWVVVGAWGLLGAPGSRRSPIGLPWGAFRGPPEPAGTWPKI